MYHRNCIVKYIQTELGKLMLFSESDDDADLMLESSLPLSLTLSQHVHGSARCNLCFLFKSEMNFDTTKKYFLHTEFFRETNTFKIDVIKKTKAENMLFVSKNVC